MIVALKLSTKKFTIPIFVIQHNAMAKQVDDFEANLAGEEGKSEETRASWFRRRKKGINTKTSEKKEMPEGLGRVAKMRWLREN